MGRTNLQKKRISINGVILTITILPLMIAIVLITAFASSMMKKGLETQVFADLETAATGVLFALNESDSGEYSLQEGEKLFKGNTPITDQMANIDAYSETNEIQLTFFYGNVRRATTIRDDSGNRILGTTASDAVVNAVLKGGNTYNSSNVSVNGKPYYGYYLPVKNSEGKIIGMVFAGKPREVVTGFMRTRVLTIVGMALLISIISISFILSVTRRRFINPLRHLSGVAAELALGNTDMEITKDNNDEFGDLEDSFIQLKNNTAAQIEVAKKMADGNLTVSYKPVSAKDTMGKSLVQMIDDNNYNLSQIQVAASNIKNGVEQVAAASQSLADGTSSQAGAIEEITVSLNGIADGAKQNAENASGADSLVKSVKEDAVKENDNMKNLIAAMRDISESSRQIDSIMKVIDDIAFQTNIIALNASVEAARAGQHGKGFAVVAEEVRSLAEKSAEAAKNSANIIDDSIRKIDAGEKLAYDAANALTEIKNSVENIAALVSDIAQASEKQSHSVSEVNQGVAQISDVVQTNSATSQQCAATSAQLSRLTEQLDHAVGKYRLR